MRSHETCSLLALTIALSGCATDIKVPEIPLLDSSAFTPAAQEAEPKPAVQYVEVPQPLPLPGQLKPVPKAADKERDDRPPKDRVVGANAAARIEPVKDGYINAIQVYPFTPGALYQLYAAVNQVTDIALEADEKLVSVSAGDTVRWVVGDTSSGEGRQAQVHILVKPIGPDLETNLVITTDRRTYHLEMRSSQSTYMASVSWTYPAAELISLRKEATDAEAARAASPIPASISMNSTSAIASKAMRPGNRGRSSMMGERSTSSSHPDWRKAKRRPSSSSVLTARRRWSIIACTAPPTSSTGFSRQQS